MQYYDFHIGDYAKKTQHLSNEEDLAYRRALDMYYDTERPLPVDNIPLLSRRLRVSLPALQMVIEEFFPKGRNKHADEKIKHFYAFIEKQRSNGRKGGRPKNQEVKSEEKPTGIPEDSQNNPSPNQPLTTYHLPLPNKNITHPSDALPSATPKTEQIPYAKIVEIYHQTLPILPKCKVLTSKRRGQIGARWKDGSLPDLDTWKSYFEYVKGSDFLMGKKDPVNGHRRFVADIEFLTNETNYAKVLEGKYHGKK